ncbi:MAG: hypothetical protein ACE5MB_03000 [Anaerolineae bacterium]
MKRLSLGILLTGLLLTAFEGLSLAAPPSGPPLQECLNVSVTSPRMNAIVRGNVEIIGSASIDNFQFYKVEYSTITDPDRWIAVSTTYNQPVINGRLDVWNTTVIPDGTYNLKLTVVDIRGQEICRVVIRQLQVANAQPTETPTPPATPTPTETPRGPTPTIAIIQPPTSTPAMAPTLAPVAVPTRRPPGLPDTSLLGDLIDVSALGQAFMLGLGSTAAIFILVGLVSFLRRLL